MYNIDKKIEKEDYLELSRSLINSHVLFYKMWELGKPVFTDAIDTAAVSFDEQGEVLLFSFNPTFWDKLTIYERQFIISHECLHVILNHGLRVFHAINKDYANIAADIVVNHMLINKFGFVRQDISMADSLCWVDTVFKNRTDVFTDRTFEYYYNLLIEGNQDVKTSFIDEHGGDYPSIFNPDVSNKSKSGKGVNKEQVSTPKEYIEKLSEELDDQTKSSINGMLAGTGAGSMSLTISTEYVKKKKKWETVIKKWSKKYDKTNLEDVEQWARINRRFVMMPNDIILPTEMEMEKEEEGKTDVWFFQDTSGSCYHYATRFFKAAKTLDPKRFNVRLFCFDTQVYETSLETGKLYGFGGTSFYIIENHIQKLIKEEKIKYPKAVFLITDGWGTPVKPEQPDKWYWFITNPGATYYVPKESNLYKLENFE